MDKRWSILKNKENDQSWGRGMSTIKIYCEKIEQIKTSQTSLGKVVHAFCPSIRKAEAADWKLWG